MKLTFLSSPVDADLVLVVLGDTAITLFLVYYLKGIKRSEYESTNSIVSNLLRTSIEANVLTASMAAGTLVLFLTRDKTGLWFVFPL